MLKFEDLTDEDSVVICNPMDYSHVDDVTVRQCDFVVCVCPDCGKVYEIIEPIYQMVDGQIQKTQRQCANCVRNAINDENKIARHHPSEV